MYLNIRHGVMLQLFMSLKHSFPGTSIRSGRWQSMLTLRITGIVTDHG